MPFWKKMFNKRQGVYYPRAVVQGKPVETETIAKDLAKISTVSNSDVQAVLGDIAGVMHTRPAAASRGFNGVMHKNEAHWSTRNCN